MKTVVVALSLSLVCAVAWADGPATVLDELSFPVNAGETQSTVVAPGNPDPNKCPAGRILISNDWARPPKTTGIVLYRDLTPGAPMESSTFDVMPDHDQYDFLTNDHDLVSLANGDVLYLSGAASRMPLSPEPAWFKAAYRGDFGPGARSVLLVWRSTDCGKHFKYEAALQFDPAVAGDRSCAFPQRPRVFRHDAGGSASLAVPTAGSTLISDPAFRWCSHCQQLVSTAEGVTSACPLGGEHHLGTGVYKVPFSFIPIPGHPDEKGLKRCLRCGTLFDAANPSTKCGARMGHEPGTFEHFLPTGDAAIADDVQPGWRWCSKCQTLFFDDAKATACPAGGSHDRNGGHYQIPLKGSKFGDEQGWNRCSKCRQLYLKVEGVPSVCPKGDAHVSDGTLYQLPKSPPPDVASQGSWRMCVKCGTLYFAGNPSRCPVVNGHDGSGSPEFHLPHEEGPGSLAGMQTQWRTCSKCGSVYFSGHPGQVCAAGRHGDEKPFYNMGGSDGQLIHVDRASGRIYLTFRCVGYVPKRQPVGTPFELSDTPLDRSLIAVSENGAPWKLLGTPKINNWRTGLLPLAADNLVLGFRSVLTTAKNTNGKWTFDPNAIDVAPGQAGWNSFDEEEAPRNLIWTNIWSHTILARTPGSNHVLMVMPDTIAGKGHGYRIFFVDAATGKTTESLSPITPAGSNTADFAMHLQAVDFGDGPVLLYWNDVDAAASAVTVRGRFVTGFDQGTNDFVISQSGGVARDFPIKGVDGFFWGDYQTAGGYKDAPGKFVYYPVWVEPDQTVHSGHVIFEAPSLSAAAPNLHAGKTVIARRVPLSSIKIDRDSEQYEERARRAAPRRDP